MRYDNRLVALDDDEVEFLVGIVADAAGAVFTGAGSLKK